VTLFLQLAELLVVLENRPNRLKLPFLFNIFRVRFDMASGG
jgi:hypothetical protein